MGKFYCYHNSLQIRHKVNEEVEFTKEELREAFKKYKNAYFFFHTSNYDCGFDSGWYYIINDVGPSGIKQSSNRNRKLNRIKKNLDIRIINYEDYKNQITNLFNIVTKRYKQFEKKEYDLSFYNKGKIVAAFIKDTDYLLGYVILFIEDKVIQLSVEKTNLDYKHLFVSYTLNDYIVNNCVDFENGEYLSNGTTTILHKTNHNSFLVDFFGFRKVYCRLNIIYRPIFKFIIPVVRLLSPIFKILDKKPFFHKINGLLFMDKVVRRQRKMFKNV